MTYSGSSGEPLRACITAAGSSRSSGTLRATATWTSRNSTGVRTSMRSILPPCTARQAAGVMVVTSWRSPFVGHRSGCGSLALVGAELGPQSAHSGLHAEAGQHPRLEDDPDHEDAQRNEDSIVCLRCCRVAFID